MEEGTGYGYPLASQVIERVLAEKEFEQRIVANEQNIAFLLEAGLTPEQIAAMDISKANIIVPGTGEKFDLDALLDTHDIAISELKAAGFAPKTWVQALSFVKIADFKARMLTTKFPLGDYPEETLPDWLMIPPKIEEVVQTPFGPITVSPEAGITGQLPSSPISPIGLITPITPPPPPVPSTPMREQVIEHIEDILSLKDRSDIARTTLATHGARLSAVEGDIEGLVARLPIVTLPSAREILTSILPLNISRPVTYRGNVSQSLSGWLKDFPVYSEIQLLKNDLEDKINAYYNFSVENKRLIDTWATDWSDWKSVVLSADWYMREASLRKRLEETNFLVGARVQALPDWLITRFTNPITGDVNDVYVDTQVGKNASGLIRLERDVGLRLDSVEEGINDIKGYKPVLGRADLDAIITDLKSRSWTIGEYVNTFQGWLEEFNSRGIGNGTLLDELRGRVDDFEFGLGEYDDGFKGDNELKTLIMGMKDEMANMREAFGHIVEDIRAFPGSLEGLLKKADEEFLFRMSMSSLAEVIRTEFNALMEGGRSRYDERGIDISGRYEYYGLKNAFGEDNTKGLRGATDILSRDAASMGGFGKSRLGWS